MPTFVNLKIIQLNTKTFELYPFLLTHENKYNNNYNSNNNNNN